MYILSLGRLISPKIYISLLLSTQVLKETTLVLPALQPILEDPQDFLPSVSVQFHTCQNLNYLIVISLYYTA